MYKFRDSTLLIALLGSLLLWAAMPPLDLWPLAWVAPVPWIWLVRREEMPGNQPYLGLFAAGFAFWLGALHWLRLPHWATSIGWVALSFYFAFYLPVFVALSRTAAHRLRVPVVIAAPVVWTGLELLRGHLLTGMTMGSIGHTQYRWIDVIQLSDLAGAYGVGFVVMLAAAALGRMLPCGQRRFTPWPLLSAVLVVAAAVGYGHFRRAGNETSPGPTVALIQGSIDIMMQYDPKLRDRVLEQYISLSREALKQSSRIDLIVWPESMFMTGERYSNSLITYDADAVVPRGYDWNVDEFRRWLPEAAEGSRLLMGQLAREFDTPLMLGVDTSHFGAKGLQIFNSAVQVGRDGRLLGRYDKIHRVIFGEYVPLAERFPFLQGLTPLPVSISAGNRPAAFDVGGTLFAPNICYESVMPHVIRRQVNELAAEGKMPEVLVNLTNDGWFWGSSELDMHLACGVFRAVECRKPLLIAANTGFSAWIDADGAIRAKAKRRATDVIIAQPRLDRRRSFYLAHGDWFAGCCLALCGLFALAGIYGRFRKKIP
jgi:apolipoprotein N-acyltransferase